MKYAFDTVQMTMFAVLLAFLMSGVGSASGKESKAPERSASFAENQFFVLDFERTSLSLADVEERFFTTFPHDEPTGGNVIYDRVQWVNDSMIRLQPGEGLYLHLKSRGKGDKFDSFRLTSKPFYNLTDSTSRILFVFKGQLPSGKGIWPAWWLNGSHEELWTYTGLDTFPVDRDLNRYSGIGHFYDTSSPVNGTDWPSAGELDIIETINGNNIFHNTLHTCPQMCDAIWSSNGVLVNCANPNEGDPNAGCSGEPYHLAEPQGTFACLWEKNRIRFYYWSPQEDVRANGGPLSSDPRPEEWGEEFLKNEVILLETETPCDSQLHQEWQCNNCSGSNSCSFVNMKMIFNTTLCGKWAGSKFDNSETPAENCSAFVRGEGRTLIDEQFMKLEYVSVRGLK